VRIRDIPNAAAHRRDRGNRSAGGAGKPPDAVHDLEVRSVAAVCSNGEELKARRPDRPPLPALQHLGFLPFATSQIANWVTDCPPTPVPGDGSGQTQLSRISKLAPGSSWRRLPVYWAAWWSK
jgi:hypothetical protein